MKPQHRQQLNLDKELLCLGWQDTFMIGRSNGNYSFKRLYKQPGKSNSSSSKVLMDANSLHELSDCHAVACQRP
jgi:hypothetical protein